MTSVPLDGVFIAIGHVPQTELFKGQIDMKPSGYIDRPLLDGDQHPRRLCRRRRG